MRFIVSILITLSISACNPNTTSFNFSSPSAYDYAQMNHIEWVDLLNQQECDYITYIYSETCGHCREIKNEILYFASSYQDPTYFVIYVKEIPLIDDKEQVIDKDKIEEIGILGTPTLFHVVNHKINENIVGSKDIKNYIEKLLK